LKKILITGGAGFIGSHIAEFLLNKNYKVGVVDLWESEEVKMFKKFPKFNFYKMNFLNLKMLKNI